MKLLLHWLIWDLRRFRLPLLLWVALLGAFMVWLGYLNSHLLTIDASLLSYNEGIAAVVGVIQVFLLLNILNSDPASGAHPFWKTRPPAGFVIAVSKLIHALFFFLILPVFCWWLVLKACGTTPEQDGTLSWRPVAITWMQLIWWCSSLTISAFAVASAASQGTAHSVLRIFTGFAVLAVPVLIWVFFELRSGKVFSRQGTELAAIVIEGSLAPSTGILWLVLAVLTFLTARRTRTPGRCVRRAHLALPLAVTAAAAWLPAREPQTKSIGLPLRPELASSLQLGEPLLQGGIQPLGGFVHSAKNRERFENYAVSLRLSGLPENFSVAGFWESLKLTAPDGRSIHMVSEEPPDFFNFQEQAGSIPIRRTCFRESELAGFSLTACRAEGIARINVKERRRRTISLQPGETFSASTTAVRLSSITPATSRQEPLLTFAATSAGLIYPRLRLERNDSTQKLPLMFNGGSESSGYFVIQKRSTWPAFVSFDASPLGAAHFVRDANEGHMNEWHAEFSWLEDAGSADVPVVIEQLIIPRQSGDEREVEGLIDKVDVPARAAKEEVRRRIKQALGLAVASGKTINVSVKADPLAAALNRFLAKVSREHLDLLMQITEEQPPETLIYANAFNKPLIHRVVELLAPGDIPAIRQRPALFRALRIQLGERKLISLVEANGPGWPDKSDAALLEEWEKSRHTNMPSLTALEYAARRGLPWVPKAVAEIFDFLPDSGEARDISQLMSSLSDIPSKNGRTPDAWLRENAARLVWDAAKESWVAPSK